MFMDGLSYKDHHILGYADESGEIVKMKFYRMISVSILKKGISGFYGETVRYDGFNRQCFCFEIKKNGIAWRGMSGDSFFTNNQPLLSIFYKIIFEI